MQNIPHALRLRIARIGNRIGIRDLDVPLRLRSRIGSVLDIANATDDGTLATALELLDDEAMSFLGSKSGVLRTPAENGWARWFEPLDDELAMRAGQRSAPWSAATGSFWTPSGSAGHEDARRRGFPTDPSWSHTDPELLTAHRAERALAIVAAVGTTGAEVALDALGQLELAEVEAAIAHLPYLPETHELFGLPATPLELLGLERTLRLGGWRDPLPIRSFCWHLLPNPNTYWTPERVAELDPDRALFLMAMRRVHIQRGYPSSYDDWYRLHEGYYRVDELLPGEDPEEAFDRTLRKIVERMGPIRAASVERIRAAHPRPASAPEFDKPVPDDVGPRTLLLPPAPAPTRRQRLWRLAGSKRLAQIGRAQFEACVRTMPEDEKHHLVFQDGAVREGTTWVSPIDVVLEQWP